MSNESLAYVLITPARNEADHIEKTLESVIAQTIRPVAWVIVSDASTDGTDEIVRRYAEAHAFITFVRRESSDRISFASKAHAIAFGINALTRQDYTFIGNLDADISLEPTYYESIFARFRANPKLGIAAGEVLNVYGENDLRRRITTERYSASGSVQMFRRECFEAVGGYRPLPRGGIDAIAEVMVRMHGWQVRTFPELHVLHHRPTGSRGGVSGLRIHYRLGRQEYVNGYHPLFVVAKSFRRVTLKPYVLGALVRIVGYFHGQFEREPIAVDDDVRDFLRREQLSRLKQGLRLRNLRTSADGTA